MLRVLRLFPGWLVGVGLSCRPRVRAPCSLWWVRRRSPVLGDSFDQQPLPPGPTGCGKSDVALRLCEALDGELINADAVQCYAGAPIATNQASATERARVPMHLLGHLDPMSGKEQTVQQWVEDARTCIDAIWARGRVAVVAGGTHYYITSLLWTGMLTEHAPLTHEQVGLFVSSSLVSC